MRAPSGLKTASRTASSVKRVSCRGQPPWLETRQRLNWPLMSLMNRNDSPSGAGCIAMIRRVAKNCSNRYWGRVAICAFPPS